jgi:RND family efflux transporter MFP subunit
LAHTTAQRWKNLLKTESVSKQETEEKISNEKANAAIVAATRANRDRLLNLVGFERIVAPFDGVIMSRTTDIGRLINTGNGTAPLFRLVQANPLRVYVRVPEYYSSNIRPDLTAELYFTEHPGKHYSSKLLETAKAIDRTTRTLLIQLVLDNPNEELLSGSYTEVHLKVPANKGAVHLPVNTLIFLSEGMHVACIDGNNKIVLKPVTLGRDYGDVVEVISGLKPGEPVVVNPPDSIFAGEKVRVVTTDGGAKETKTA